MDKTVFRVVPSNSNEWNVFEQGYEKPLSMFKEKDDAVNYALDMARTKEAADVAICSADGRVESTRSVELK